MLSKLKFLLVIFIFSSLFLFARDSVFSAPLCSFDENDHPYSYNTYRCDTRDYVSVHCIKTTHGGVGNCDQFNVSGQCGFCGVPSQTCTATKLKDPDGGFYWDCNIKKDYQPRGSYCTSARWIACGPEDPPACTPKTIDCTNKCGKIDRGCPNVDPKDCGRCNAAAGYSCVSNKCIKDTPSCSPLRLSDCGTNYLCGVQNDGCGGTITCGGCNSGSSCQGKNSQGRNGTCKKDPTPTPPPGGTPTPVQNSITGMIFYDKYGTSSNKKGSEPSYGNCYPATNATGSGPASGNVSLTVENANGTKTESYPTVKSYKNCTRNGSTGGSKGFLLNSAYSCKSVKLNIPSGYKSTGYNYQIGSGSTTVVTTGQLDRTPVICGNVTVRFGIESGTPPVRVSGLVFIDDNGNNQYDPGEESVNNPDGNNEGCYVGNTNVVVNGVNNTFASTKSCNSFSITKGAGSQTVSLGAINQYSFRGLAYRDATHANWTYVDDANSIPINGNGEVRFAIRPADSTFSISGNLFTDDKTPYKSKGSTENNYCGGANSNRTISAYDSQTGLLAGQTFQNNSGSGQCGNGYSIAGLDPGNYKVVYTNLPSGYNMQYPVNNPPPDPSFYVTVGGSCSTIDYNFDRTQGTGDLHTQASCVNGDVQDLNFGIIVANQEPWFQSIGGDVRSDTKNISRVPSTGTCTAVSGMNPTTPYLSTTTTLLDNGVVFSATLTDLAGSADRSNIRKWLVLGNTFDPVRTGTIRTSYSYLYNVLTKGGIPIKEMFGTGNVCAGSGGAPHCKPPTTAAAFPSGVYHAKRISSGDAAMRIDGSGNYTFPANSNYIILIEGGNLRFDRNIIVPTSTTVIFAVQGSITVDPDVTRIDGMFSADVDFRAYSNGLNAVNDIPLTINGNVITNAAQNEDDPGTFENERDLGQTNNAKCPSVTVKSRPDFVVNAPATIRYPNYIIQEVNP